MAQLQHTISSKFNQPNQQAEPLKETNPKKKKKKEEIKYYKSLKY